MLHVGLHLARRVVTREQDVVVEDARLGGVVTVERMIVPGFAFASGRGGT